MADTENKKSDVRSVAWAFWNMVAVILLMYYLFGNYEETERLKWFSFYLVAMLSGIQQLILKLNKL